MWPLLTLLGIGVAASLIWKGQQFIIPQTATTWWYSDPYQFDSYGENGDGGFFQGADPPGEAPPWRLASEWELSHRGQGYFSP